MFNFWLVVLALCGLSQANFTENCMQCICEAEGCEDNIGTCMNEGGVIYCGPYNINEPYYIDCGTPGADWISCTTQLDCSETCVVAYMDRYGEFCTGGVTPVCEDYARIHHGGPNGCNSDTTDDYWEVVSACCSSVGGCD